MKLSKVIARNVIFPLTAFTGLNRILSNSSVNNGLVIMYHGITKKNTNWFSPRHLSEEQFEEHLRYLKHNFDCVSLTELIHSAPKNKNRKQIALTFDDGYLNNLTVALPLIEKYQIPVTFFISGICTEEKPINYLFPDLLQALERLKLKELKWVFDEMKLSDELKSSQLDFYSIAKKLNDGGYVVKEASMSKLLSTKMADEVIYDALQLLGGYGYMEEYPMARLLRDSRLGPIGGGTSEILKEIIAKIVIDGKEYKPVT